jgi:hypothetical protein
LPTVGAVSPGDDRGILIARLDDYRKHGAGAPAAHIFYPNRDRDSAWTMGDEIQRAQRRERDFHDVGIIRDRDKPRYLIAVRIA